MPASLWSSVCVSVAPLPVQLPADKPWRAEEDGQVTGPLSPSGDLEEAPGFWLLVSDLPSMPTQE